MIEARRVSVNDKIVEKPGVVIDEAVDKVKVDGLEVAPVSEQVYVLLNKPSGVMSTLVDPFRRKTVVQLLKKLKHRVYPIGRLDYDTEGVLLLTNDGDLAFRLAHPKFEVSKVYEARVKGKFTREDGVTIQHGIKLDDGGTGQAIVHILGYGANSSRLRLILTEGRKREVKQLCKKVGHAVEHLARVEFAGITAKGVLSGQWRLLTETEVGRLRKLVGLE
jgi:pseudouridine synthase